MNGNKPPINANKHKGGIPAGRAPGHACAAPESSAPPPAESGQSETGQSETGQSVSRAPGGRSVPHPWYATVL
eukprot:459768-Prorocentrum_minimum.AAC.1